MIQIQHRRGLASEWTSVNPILAEGEMGVEIDTLKVKMGDGVTHWNYLVYFTQGEIGPANSLDIGTVTSGPTPSATITGDAPFQTLNLVMEKGDAATVAVGTTTNKLPGTTAEVVNVGDENDAIFDFKIPRGATVAVGSTTTGSTSSVAAVTNSGTASDLVLDFAIPRGAGVPTGGTAGQILTKSSATDFDTLWQENYADWTSQVKHNVKAGVALSKGMPVYVTDANGTNMIVGKAGNASEATSSKTMGLLQQDLALNGTGFVITEGLLAGVDTSSATAGDPIWLGPAGTLLYGISAKPVAPAHLVFIGVVTRAHATQGEIWIKVQNGFELNELHDILITSPTNGQAITYQDGLWVNATPASALDDLDDVNVTSPVAKQVLKYDGTEWVNATASGGVTVSETTPVDPSQGDGWFFAADGTQFVRYDDGTSVQWVQPNAVLSSQIEQRYYSPNYIINGAFDIWQRGTSFSNPSAASYTADRFNQNWNGSGATRTISREGLNGNEITGLNAQYFYRYNQTVAGTGGSYNYVLMQPIEDVRSLAGQTTTVSFWARSTTSSAFTISLDQSFGSGGSSYLSTSFGNVSLSSSWQRYSLTGVVPSVSGKTIGANSYLLLVVRAAANAVINIDLAGVQVEEGSTATAFRRNANSTQGELAACQRYYYRLSGTWAHSLGLALMPATSGSSIVFMMPYKVSMRAAATTVESAGLEVTDPGVAEIPVTGSFTTYVVGSEVGAITLTRASGTFSAYKTYGVRFGSAGYIGWSAEL